MPFIAITVPAGTADSVKRGLAGTFTDLVADILGKRRAVTSTLVQETGAAVWAVGGVPAPMAAHAEIAVTAGTNSAEEKAEMVRRGHSALAAALPGLPEATYVVIREIGGDAWGYEGTTQAARQATRSSPA